MKTVFCAFALTAPFLAGCDAATEVALPEREVELLFDFPDVPGWKRGPPMLFEEEGAGYAVGYQAPPAHATVYVYDAGLTEIPDDLDAAPVQQEFNNATAGIMMMKRSGVYRSVAEGAAETVSLGDAPDAIQALHRRYAIVMRQGEEVDSDVYLTVFRDHFVKVRVTRPASSGETNQAAIDRLLAEVGRVLREGAQ